MRGGDAAGFGYWFRPWFIHRGNGQADYCEMGCSAVLVNSAIAAAGDPVAMASAFAMAVKAGTLARQAGLMAQSGHAIATSPLTSFLSGDQV